MCPATDRLPAYKCVGLARQSLNDYVTRLIRRAIRPPEGRSPCSALGGSFRGLGQSSAFRRQLERRFSERSRVRPGACVPRRPFLAAAELDSTVDILGNQARLVGRNGRTRRCVS